MSTVTLARLYEDQGHAKDALGIYKSIVIKDPQNTLAIEGIKRLSKKHTHFAPLNEKMYEMFVNSEEQDYNNFQEWLVQWN